MPGPNFGVDGMELLDRIIQAGTPDPYSRALLQIGKKYGLNSLQTMAFMSEVAVLFQQKADEDKQKEAQEE